MPDFLKKYLDQFKEFWNSLEKSQKTRIYITSAIVVLAVTISLIYLSRPNRIVLFTNSDQKQIGEMVKVLDDNGIWNEAKDNGTSIVIDSKNNNNAQIVLAQAGYPKEGFTFEDAISSIGITTTQDDKKHIWKRQQISDLEAKINMLDNIDEAAVTLATPETSIFLNASQEQQKPTAYVMVRPNKELTKTQIQGIVMLVSKSVENLNPSDVTVVDNNGNILNSTSLDDPISDASSQEELRKKRETELEQKVLSYFSGGQFDNFDTLRVVANATLDFDKEKSQTKSITNPEGMDSGAIISNKLTSEVVKNGTTGGEPGVGTNPGATSTPTYQTGDGSNSDYKNDTEENNYAYDEKVTDQEKAAGKLIPEESGIAISLWYGNKVTDDTKMDTNFISEVKQAASSATGVPVNNISVNKMKLASPEVVTKTMSERVNELVSNYGFLALMLLLIIATLIVGLPRRKRQPAEELVQPALTDGPKFVMPEHEEPLPDIELEERSEIKKQLDKFVKQKPDAVAQLLRNWLSDDWDG